MRGCDDHELKKGLQQAGQYQGRRVLASIKARTTELLNGDCIQGLAFSETGGDAGGPESGMDVVGQTPAQWSKYD